MADNPDDPFDDEMDAPPPPDFEPEPDMPAYRDFRRLSDRIHAELERQSDDGKPPDMMRLVIDIPAEWAALAAWVHIRRIYREDGKPGPENTHIDFPPILGHKVKAKAELRNALHEWFHEQLHWLATCGDPVLFPKGTPVETPAQIEAAAQRRKKMH